jgi:hypothetical protein
LTLARMVRSRALVALTDLGLVRRALFDPLVAVVDASAGFAVATHGRTLSVPAYAMKPERR